MFPNCDDWTTVSNGMILKDAICLDCADGYSEFNSSCIKCENYPDNWYGCSDCTVSDNGLPLDCTECMNDLVLLNNVQGVNPAHQCGYPKI